MAIIINIWRQIDTLPKNKEPFLADRSIRDGRKSGGELLRRSQIFTQHEFEQLANDFRHFSGRDIGNEPRMGRRDDRNRYHSTF